MNSNTNENEMTTIHTMSNEDLIESQASEIRVLRSNIEYLSNARVSAGIALEAEQTKVRIAQMQLKVCQENHEEIQTLTHRMIETSNNVWIRRVKALNERIAELEKGIITTPTELQRAAMASV